MDYLLLSLKIIGIVGTYLGLASSEAEAGKQKRKRPGLLKYVTLFFLLIAIGAEVVDTIRQRNEAQASAMKFARLAHPLGDIDVGGNLIVDISGPQFQQVRVSLEKLLQANSAREDCVSGPCNLRISRDGLDSQTARVLYDTPISLRFQISTAESIKSKGNEELRQADLAFVVQDPSTNTQTSRAVFYYPNGASGAGRPSLGVVVGLIRNPSADRTTDGAIISSEDIRGSTIETRVCMNVSSEEAFWGSITSFDGISIGFPGRENTYGLDGVNVKKWDRDESNPKCLNARIDVPYDPAALKKLEIY